MSYNCRICMKELEYKILDLNTAPPSNALLMKYQLDMPETYYPLRLYFCNNCGLVQLPEFVPPRDMFNSSYPYYSSQSPSNVSHAAELVELMVKRFNPNSIFEIGSNDGYLLQHVPDDIEVVGFEPATGPAEIASNAKGILTYRMFFNAGTVKELGLQDCADVICSINVFAHNPYLHDFIRGLKLALAPNGVIVFEFPHVVNLVNDCQFDTIYHEHYSYFSFNVVNELFKKYNMEIYDVEEIPTHGGSLRIFVQHSNTGSRAVLPSVHDLFLYELNGEYHRLDTYESLQRKTDFIKTSLLRTILNLKGMNKSIAAYGAAAKGCTLLNYCGITPDMISFVADRSIYKHGKFLPGSHIPVVDEAYLKEHKPDYVLILPWNLKEELMHQLSYIKEWGGRLILISKEGVDLIW